MTDAEKISTVQTLLDNDAAATSALVTVYLSKASAAIMRRLYPFGVPSTVTEVPEIYEMLQCELAVRYFDRRGGEGEKAHNENGINRTYGSVNDEDLLMEITPYAMVATGESTDANT